VQALALAGVIWVAYVNAGPGSFARRSLAAAGNHAPPPGWQDFQRVDQIVVSAGTAGNLFVRFTGFSPDDPADALFASRFYYRAAYTLWPRRIFVGPPDRIINDGEDLISTRFERNTEWLGRHHVRAVLRVVRTADGSIEFRTDSN
jgi:hypothetical protein